MGLVGLLAGCAGNSARTSGSDTRVFDARLGVWSTPRVVAEGDAVPRGGGGYLTGRPYRIGGRTYVPSSNPNGYSVIGTASWYGDAFHGRRTANGEIFDKGSISAAHPTLPLPSYVRVTNLKNGRSMVVRVNDRGPYHGGRVMDVSQRVAEALAFRGEGTAHVKVDYLGRASLSGSDDAKLMASLRTDGSPAALDGMPSDAVALTDRDATAPQGQGITDASGSPVVLATDAPQPPSRRFAAVPLPPPRPFSFDDEAAPPVLPPRRKAGDDVAGLIARHPAPFQFDETETGSATRGPGRGQASRAAGSNQP